MMVPKGGKTEKNIVAERYTDGIWIFSRGPKCIHLDLLSKDRGNNIGNLNDLQDVSLVELIYHVFIAWKMQLL